MEEQDRKKYMLQSFQIRMYLHTGQLTKRILCTSCKGPECVICKGAGWYRKKD